MSLFRTSKILTGMLLVPDDFWKSSENVIKDISFF